MKMTYVIDWFNDLLKTNEIIKNDRVNMVPFLADPTPVVELIFLVCSLFGQPDEVRYLSVELFDRFIRLHFKCLLAKVWNQETEPAYEQWKRVEAKLFFQTTLRILSCIQLASKFVLHSKILRPKDIQTYLQAEGKTFTLQMVLSSEMRVWRTLNFQINIPTVITYVDLILEKIKMTSYSYLIPKHASKKTILFTDVVYLHHQEIYRKLFYLSTGHWEATVKERHEFLPTECNVLYRATGVVGLLMTFSSAMLNNYIVNNLAIYLICLPKTYKLLLVS